MIKSKSTCGLCKPHKKWKKNNTKEKRKNAINIEDELSFQTFKIRSLDEIREEIGGSKKYKKEFIDSVIKGLSESSLYTSR